MPPTKQTARRSTGGRAPRKQLATRPAVRRSYYSGGDDDSDNNKDGSGFGGQPQVDMFTQTNTRTIVVEGTSELYEAPDLIKLSFLISETADTLSEGIHKVLQKLGEARSIVTEDCGIPNSNVTSDSIGSRGIKTEYGYNQPIRNEDGETEDYKFQLTETKIVYEVKSVLRISLEGGSGGDDDDINNNQDGNNNNNNNVQDDENDGAAELSQTFSKVLYTLLSKAGLRTHDAPTYDLIDLTYYRNMARSAACENAKSKAETILEALNDPSIKLGRPICITDLFCNNQDDATNSFTGNYISWSTNREILDSPPTAKTTTSKNNKEADDDDNKDGGSSSPDAKRAKLTAEEKQQQEEREKVTSTLPPLDETLAAQMFVVPQIKISARIRTVFEIVDVAEEEDDNIDKETTVEMMDSE